MASVVAEPSEAGVESVARGLFRRCKELRRAGHNDQALRLLREALRRRSLDPEQIVHAGRLIATSLAGAPAAAGAVTVLLLGQCTTSWLVPTLTAVAFGHGGAVKVRDGEYDNVIQHLLRLSERPEVTILLPWHQRLLSTPGRPAAERVADELEFLEHAWTLVRQTGSRLLQVGYDWVGPGSLGHHLGGRSHGDVCVVRQLNEALRNALPDGSYFVDLEQLSAIVGHDAFYDSRSYYWTKQPFSPPGLVHLGEHLWAGIRAVTTGPKKVLVLDLDNTLWGGVVGEVGPLGIALGDTPEGEAYRAFQRHVKMLSERGVVLAACSKNNPADAREPFETHRDMILSLADFAAFEASWEPKPVVIERIARTLQLGLDSFVFFDDSPSEREHVRQSLPDVEVVEVPTDPADYISALQQGLWFEALAVTEVDRQRVQQYREESQRREFREAAGTLSGYLTSLQMCAQIRPIDEDDIERVVQLLAKTNQFNLTTRRHVAADVRRFTEALGTVGLTVRLTDRFGDYGLISVVIGVPLPNSSVPTLRLDTWLMSCRAIGRTVEEYLLNHVMQAARLLNYEMVVGEFIPTAKNGLVADFYTRVGFRPLTSADDRVKRYNVDLSSFTPLQSFVTPEA
jgi:FkbH-like protein